ncbi:MAG TPA: NAD(P)/FAD-dependent oxidoreductase [Caulobacteraceae bacterium]
MGNGRAANAFDVIVVGGGPAGSVMAWSLANQGVRVAILERSIFPREKVCGDFVEPGGLRILRAMGCLETLEEPTPIANARVYFGPRLAFQGPIPYYEATEELPAHGYIVPRDILDTRLQERARAAGAVVYEGCEAKGIRREAGAIEIAARQGGRDIALTAPLVVGADGAESLVARSFSLRRTDRRHIGISQRAYVEGIEIDPGEATIWFDEDLYPGYGWMFPMSGGRANVGVGMLSETCHRQGLSAPKAFAACIEKLRLRHPGCANVHVASRPLGGVVKMYGGAGPNHFDGGLLVGDAGSFVDPMTGEGITQGMESSLIASRTILGALEVGRFDTAFLARYERDFRSYFDPAMLFLDLCAAMMRNWHFREFWLRATARGFDEASSDPAFARVSGAAFGGLNVRPLAIVEQVWSRILGHVGAGGARAVTDLLSGRGSGGGLGGDLAAWRRGWDRSIAEDPAWHFAWLGDVLVKSAKLQMTLWNPAAPRVRGPLVTTPATPLVREG